MFHDLLRAVFLAACFLVGWFLSGAYLQTAEAAPQPNTYILIGDSNMSAVAPSSVGGSYGPTSKMASALLEKELNISIRNLSSPGAALGGSGAMGYISITPAMMTINGFFSYVDGVIVTAGTNDHGGSVKPGDTSTALRNILNWARKYKKKVLVMDIPFKQGETIKNRIGQPLGTYRWAIGVVCAQYKDVCIFAPRSGTAFDGFTPSLYDPAEVANNRALHLNEAGHRVFADWVKSVGNANNFF